MAEYKTYSGKLKDPRWQKKRLEILNRDDFTCWHCGSLKKTLHVHHYAYVGDPWEADNELLITLCEDCHKKEEDSIKEIIPDTVRRLKLCGFGANAFDSLPKIFEGTKKDYWNSYDPAFYILEMVVNDPDLWDRMEKLYFKRLREKYKSMSDSFPEELQNAIAVK